jgi:hypothetical protein
MSVMMYCLKSLVHVSFEKEGERLLPGEDTVEEVEDEDADKEGEKEPEGGVGITVEVCNEGDRRVMLRDNRFDRA